MAPNNRDFPFAFLLPTDLVAEIGITTVPTRDLPYRNRPRRSVRRWPWHSAGRYAA
jgi:hypothetical protein